MVSVVSNYLE